MSGSFGAALFRGRRIVHRRDGGFDGIGSSALDSGPSADHRRPRRKRLLLTAEARIYIRQPAARQRQGQEGDKPRVQNAGTRGSLSC